ncbi:hypothetical protein BDQ17DRAFT_1323225 [Cyathus striatus]|nr:hypothetical protein BDQ17DRAFT_1323225 [Cyathus striatus]
MSRRESRASLTSRQNDALFEFESFKKKFLLANKHITKLNSTLSVRIEELNAQISTLYVENLRLRASEIALAAQLKREKEKSRKVMAEAEAATLSLTKHLHYIRQSLNIPEASPTPPSPPSPRARRPTVPNPTSPTSPQANRISRAPGVPGIYEDEEPLPSSSEQDPEPGKSPGRRKSTRSKPRLSASKLPLPTLTSSPPPPPVPTTSTHTHMDLASLSTPSSKRKPSRRQSGLLTVNTEALSVPRPASPAFGSPIRLQAGRAEEEEERAVAREVMLVHDEDAMDVDVFESNAKKEKERKKNNKKNINMYTHEMNEVQDIGEGGARSRSSKRQRDEDDGTDIPKFKLKDVTNSRSALQPIDNTVHEPEEPTSASRPFLAAGSDPTSRPNSRGSTSPVPPPDSDPNAVGGRERRVRKSVNYAEPKLNTKMRKPDPAPGGETIKKKRTSAAAIMVPSSSSSSRKQLEQDGDEGEETEARSSLEQPALPLRNARGGFVDPELFPLPPSRPSSSIAGSYSPGPPAKLSSASSSSGSSGGSLSVRKRKSRPQLTPNEEDESDGAEADGEYVPPGQRGAWINTEGRRKAVSVRRVLTNVGGDETRRTQEGEGRRHSMAV